MWPMRHPVRPRAVRSRTAAVAALLLGCGALTVLGPSPSAAGDAAASDRVAEIAEVHDRSAAEVEQLLDDPAVRVGEGGRLYYADPARPVAPSARETPRARALRTAPLTLDDDTFRLHSRPGAARVIFLDFDGHDVRRTAWNSEGWPSGFWPGFSLDRDRDEFSAQERAVVREVWQRVAEDYAPFDVDVTTEDPGEAALTRSSRRDQHFGMRVVVTDTTASPVLRRAARTVCGGCAGLAWMDVFDEPDNARYQPALIFADQLRQDPWQIAETISHEVGHTFGLVHDGDHRGSYHLGTPPWSPIMGAGAAGLSQWSRGEYAGARNVDAKRRRIPLQDDLAVIAAMTGWVRDDHGDSSQSATALGGGATQTVSGTIGRTGDVDVFALTRTCDAPATIRATPAAVGANLDVWLRVRDARGRVLADANPTATGERWSPVVHGLDAAVELASVRGTSYVEVRGGSQGSPATGWSSYGSLGAYTLTVTTCAETARPGPPPPVTQPDPGPPPKLDPQSPPPPAARAPLAPAAVKVMRGRRGGKRSIVVRWTAARPRGSDVTAYVLRARKHQGGRIVARKQGRVQPGKRRVEWRVGAGVWSVRVVARSRAGASATPWTARVRAR